MKENKECIAFYCSKTFWFNIIMLFIGVVEIAQNSLSVDEKSAGVLVMLVAVGNLILRLYFTSAPTDKGRFGDNDE